MRAMGVDFQTNVVIGKTVTIDELMNEEGYDVVFVATGAGLPKFMGVPGENLNGVYSANEFLTRVNLMRANDFPEYDEPVYDCRGKDVAVVGGGNTAMDAVRTASRLGAKTSYLIYRRSEAEMPARAEEVKHAKEEGITFMCLTNPVAFLGNKEGFLEAVRCIKMELGEPDASGRRSPKPVPGSEFELPIQVAIIALGTEANPLVQSTTPDLKTTRKGYIAADPETLKTSKRGRLRRRRHRHRRRHRDPCHGRRPQGRRVDRPSTCKPASGTPRPARDPSPDDQSPRHAAALLENLIPEPLHDRHEGLALSLGPQPTRRPVHEFRDLAPGQLPAESPAVKALWANSRHLLIKTPLVPGVNPGSSTTNTLDRMRSISTGSLGHSSSLAPAGTSSLQMALSSRIPRGASPSSVPTPITLVSPRPDIIHDLDRLREESTRWCDGRSAASSHHRCSTALPGREGPPLCTRLTFRLSASEGIVYVVRT